MKKIILLSAFAGIIASCSNPVDNSMSNKAALNKARVQQFYDQVINAHNVSMIDSFCTSDFTDHNPQNGHSGKGTDDLRAVFTEMIGGMPDIHVNTEYMIAQGDTVVAYLTMSGTNSGAMGPMPATNKSFKVNGIDILVIKGDKATDRWGVFDNMSMMAQLGMMGGAPPADAGKMEEKKK